MSKSKYKTPKESTKKKNFFIIPHYENYSIRESDGKVFNEKLEKFLEGNVNPAGYFNYRLTADGKTTTLGRHFLKKLTFDYRSDYKDLVVDHDNEVKGDDRMKNLVWRTQKENVEKSGAVGANPNCKPVSIKDITTGKISNFNSISHAASVLKVGTDAISYRINLGKAFSDGNLYYFTGKKKVSKK